MLLARELTERVIGLAIEVHRLTGPGMLESVLRAASAMSWRKRESPSNGKPEFRLLTRRGEIGLRHHVSGAYLVRYAQESAWCEDNRRVSNGHQVPNVMALSMASRPSVDFCGYWQRAEKAA
jgi:hypothetical protein